MERNLDLLNKTRINYSKLLIEIGMQYLKLVPHADPQEFLDVFLPSYDDNLAILRKEQIRLENKNILKVQEDRFIRLF